MTSPARAIALGLLLCCLVTWTSSEKLISVALPVEILGECPLDVDYPECKYSHIDFVPECETDVDCEVKKKCCFSGCRNRCLLPLQGKPGTCPYYDASPLIYMKTTPSECHDDKQCQGSDRCCCSNYRRECTPTVIVKPGYCPSVKECPVEDPELSLSKVSLVEPLVVKPRCQNDGDCLGTLKCCNSCGKKCVEPIKENPGFCPANNEQISCFTTLGKPLCKTDADCKKGQKCCLSKDRMQCVTALKEKEGCCPKSSIFTICAYPPLASKCLSDSNCFGKQKCCTSLCQKKCTDPIPAVKPGTCPVVNVSVCKLPSPPNECKIDCDCLDKKKCCNDGCVFKCVDV